jgi:hypothetical protein
MEYALILTALLIDENGNVVNSQTAVGGLKTNGTTSTEDRDTFSNKFSEAKFAMEICDEENILKF